MKKHKIVKIGGVKVAQEIKKDSDRPLFPRPVVFKDKRKYDRKRDKRVNYDY